MKFSIISDVHVKNPNDQAEDLLIKFLQNEDVISSDGIFLIGDIFDLMIGPHSQYFSRFQRYFEELKKLLEANKKIYYVEGNHDFHLKNLYKNFFKVHTHLDSNLFQMKSEFVLEDNNKKIYFAHGDDVEIENFNYRLFKSVVTSMPVTIYATHFMPYFLITKVGEASSNASRKRNNKRYVTDSDLGPVKEKFRKSAEMFNVTKKYDIIVCGHSHVKDHFISKNNFEYVNNGYAQHSKSYISINNGNIEFKNI